MPESLSLIAIDIGNSRVKVGVFVQPADCQSAALAAPLPIAGATLPEPDEAFGFAPPRGEDLDDQPWAVWLADRLTPGSRVGLASVHRGVETQLLATLESTGAEVFRLTNDQAPIEVRVEHPERVGTDRLMAAVAANRLRHAGRAAIVVDVGTAITVDLVASDGGFEGGAILPGIAMAARALHEQTDALPRSALDELEASPDAVGKSTADAIEAGLFWGAVGAVRELIDRQSDRLTTPPQIFLTGGAAPSVGRLLGGPDTSVRCVPNLVLSGIAVTMESHQ